MAKKQCGECCYLDVCKVEKGKYLCEKKKTWIYANSTDADDCRSYCKRWLKDAYLGEQAIKTSSDYLKSLNNSDCYITTVVVSILGLPDSCDELTTLREFRKNYMQQNPECKDLLVKYDALGPTIAKIIQAQENQEQLAIDLYNIFIKGSVKYIKLKQYEKAIILYKEMMDGLIKEFIPTYVIGDQVYQNYDMLKSGHGKIVLKESKRP